MMIVAIAMVIAERLKELFVKYFPFCAVCFSGFYIYALAGCIQRGYVVNKTEVFIIAWIVTLLALIWALMTRKKS